jgi:ribosomal protein L2
MVLGLDQFREPREVGGEPVGEFQQLRVSLGDVQHPEHEPPRGAAVHAIEFAADKPAQLWQFAGEQQRLVQRQRVH